MEDQEMIALLFQREESALVQLERKYGVLCRDIARHILPDSRDVEECISDGWLRIWNAIPPQRPISLPAFLCRIVRNLALDRYTYNTAAQRSTALTEAFEELDPFLEDAGQSPESFAEQSDFRIFLNGFLRSLSKDNRVYFVRRYWYGESVREIADGCNVSEQTVKSSLHRTRLRLKNAMRKECIAL